MKRPFPQIDVDYISGVMSLRRPQKTSLKRLADILDEVQLSKDMPLDSALDTVNNLYPICKDFERNFSATRDFDASQSLDSVQEDLVTQMIKEIVDAIFNAAVANW